jgi:hypothetical protein
MAITEKFAGVLAHFAQGHGNPPRRTLRCVNLRVSWNSEG